MSNPFDARQRRFHVLSNIHNEYSLWPAHLAVPAGWQMELTNAPQNDCIDFIDQHWPKPAKHGG